MSDKRIFNGEGSLPDEVSEDIADKIELPIFDTYANPLKSQDSNVDVIETQFKGISVKHFKYKENSINHPNYKLKNAVLDFNNKTVNNCIFMKIKKSKQIFNQSFLSNFSKKKQKSANLSIIDRNKISFSPEPEFDKTNANNYNTTQRKSKNANINSNNTKKMLNSNIKLISQNQK